MTMYFVVRPEKKDEFVRMMLGMLEFVGEQHREMREHALPPMYDRALRATTRKYVAAINRLINVANVYKKVWRYEIVKDHRLLSDIGMDFNICEFFEIVEE